MTKTSDLDSLFVKHNQNFSVEKKLWNENFWFEKCLTFFSSYRVIIGDIVPDRREEFSVQSIVTHDDFSDSDGSNDVAVVTLKQRFDAATPEKGRFIVFDGIVRPLCLPEVNATQFFDHCETLPFEASRQGDFRMLLFYNREDFILIWKRTYILLLLFPIKRLIQLYNALYFRVVYLPIFKISELVIIVFVSFQGTSLKSRVVLHRKRKRNWFAPKAKARPPRRWSVETRDFDLQSSQGCLQRTVTW